MCTHPQHLSETDQRLLRVMAISRWPCPGCGLPQVPAAPGGAL